MKKIKTLLLLFVFSTAQAAAAFSDVPSSDPYAESIQKLEEQGIMKGNPDGRFLPERFLNRAELTAIVIRAAEISPSASDLNCFPDVSTEWFAGTICAAKRLGIVSGYQDGFFRPAQEVTAGQAAKIMVNALKQQSFLDLQEALSYVEARSLFRQRYSLNQLLKRNEAAERISRLLIYPGDDQMDAQGNPFDPEKNTIRTEEQSSVPSSESESAQMPPRYITYTAQEYDVLKGEQPLILFFHAPWCPLCRRSDGVISASLNDLKGGLTWFKVDYDTELGLRKDYQITYQDTFIVLDASGKEVKRVNGVKTKEEAQALLDAAFNQ